MDPDRTCVVVSASGKGGVGKTTLSTVEVLWLARAGWSVGLLDADIRDPNAHQALGLNGAKPRVDDDGTPHPLDFTFPGGPTIPVYSSGFVFKPGRGILSDGGMIRQLVTDFVLVTAWPKDLHILVIDVDPSAGDSIRAITDAMRHVAAVVVCEDDRSTLSDCARQVDAFDAMGVEVLGVVGNRLGYTGPREAASEEANIKRNAASWGVPYLGGLPFNPLFRKKNLEAIATIGRPLGEHLAGVIGGWARGRVAR